jgi:hypothetical protein
MYDDNLGACAVAHGDRILAIDFPEDGKLRWRKVVRRSGSRPTGKYPSWKMKRMMQWESHNELNALRLLDADPTVTAFYEQPVRIRFVLDEEQHIHVPDLLVLTANNKFIWEVKPKIHADSVDVQERTAFLTSCLPNFGYQYHVVLGEDLGKKSRIEAVNQVLRFGRFDIPVNEREHIRIALQAAGAPITWGAVLDGLFGERGRNYICRLLLEGFLQWNSEAVMTRETVLKAREVSLPTLCIAGA